ncbi:MAG: UDP-galactopyranose mutase [Desulfovibrio sp.]|nr:UDP-galactopyranose mutase [Desulfovibrio sp.]
MSRPILIVGAGLSGAVMAERIANDLDRPVTVIDKRNHIGGNCWSEIDSETGIECHKYGSHIFHTSNREVWEYISRFTEWNTYQHRVWTSYQGRIYSMPINLQTINSYYGLNLTPEEAKAFIQAEAAKENITEPRNLEEKAISLIGRPLYEAFIRGYTLKQWEKDPRELDPSIITRLPVRYNYNNRYFNDTWEGIPLHGYAKMFERMLSHPNITVQLNTDWFDIRDSISPDTLVIYTGPIDQFFDYRFGRLEWRTVDFTIERHNCADYQGASVINSADPETPYTRIHEFKHYHPEREDTGKTVIYREYSRFAGEGDEPYYPVSTEINKNIYNKYKILEYENDNIIFSGRLWLYRYLDMDVSIKENIIKIRLLKNKLYEK